MSVLTLRRAFAPLSLCVVLALALSACGRTEARPTGDADLQLRWTLDPDPPQVGRGSIRVDVADVSWKPRNGVRVILTGVRDGVALVVDTARGEGAGRYRAPGFRFEVAGPWILRARVETPEGRWTEEEYPVEVVAGEP
ncbi:MAG TPA: hypothetical protein VJ997_02845 [Longimicrobiales bacterium]|nr:hypothetical protein [Longimicrobiales bacterium]